MAAMADRRDGNGARGRFRQGGAARAGKGDARGRGKTVGMSYWAEAEQPWRIRRRTEELGDEQKRERESWPAAQVFNGEGEASGCAISCSSEPRRQLRVPGARSGAKGQRAATDGKAEEQTAAGVHCSSTDSPSSSLLFS